MSEILRDLREIIADEQIKKINTVFCSNINCTVKKPWREMYICLGITCDCNYLAFCSENCFYGYEHTKKGRKP